MTEAFSDVFDIGVPRTVSWAARVKPGNPSTVRSIAGEIYAALQRSPECISFVPWAAVYLVRNLTSTIPGVLPISLGSVYRSKITSKSHWLPWLTGCNLVPNLFRCEFGPWTSSKREMSGTMEERDRTIQNTSASSKLVCDNATHDILDMLDVYRNLHITT